MGSAVLDTPLLHTCCHLHWRRCAQLTGLCTKAALAEQHRALQHDAVRSTMSWHGLALRQLTGTWRDQQRFTREAVDSPSLEVPKTWLEKAWAGMI